MKLKHIYILIFGLFFSTQLIAQAPGLFGKTRIITAGVGIGYTPLQDDFAPNISFTLAYERSRNRVRASGVYYRTCPVDKDRYTAANSTVIYNATTKTRVHDIMWRWTWSNKTHGGLSPVGRYGTIALGTGIASIKFDTTNSTGSGNLAAPFRKFIFAPMICLGMGRRTIITESILLNFGVEVAYRYRFDTSYPDNSLSLTSLARFYIGACYLLK